MNIEELKRLAEANYGWRNASSAWPHKSGDGAAVVGNVDDSHEPAIRNPVAVVDVTQYDGFQDDSMQLAQFYAAANPAAVLELIAEVERVTKQRDELLAALKELFSDIQDLIGESYGVSGLHRNGDIAPWEELEPGGQFERLYGLISASAAIAKAEG